MSAKSDGIIYLDHHATTPCAPEVVQAMLPYFTEKFGNASSVDHHYGAEAAEAVENAREQVAKLINSRPEEIIFTSGATESDNLAIFGTTALAPKEKRHIITTQVEHKAVLEPMKRLEKQGWNITYLGVDECANIDLGELEEAIGDDTFLISIMAANNEVGTIYPLKEIGKLAKKYGVLFHTDAAQAVGHIPIDVQEMGIDLLSMSAHKMYGPNGVGGLYVRRRDPRVKIKAIQFGGEQENRRRPGTISVPSVVGFGAASMLKRPSHLKSLRNQIWSELHEVYKNAKIVGLPLDSPKRLPHNLGVTLPPMENQAIVKLVAHQIAISTGSACSSGYVDTSHVLAAMGLSMEDQNGFIRFGLGNSNCPEDLEKIVKSMENAVKKLYAITLT